MSDTRITVQGEAIEVAGRFSSEAELDAFCERLWGIFFALHPEAVEDGAPGREAAPVELPQLPHPSVVTAGLEPAIHGSPAERHGVDARHKAGHDAAREKIVPGDDAAAWARCSPAERRAVLLFRKHGDRNAVAREMEINPNSVTNLLGCARRKVVQI
jgi:hypothetical protein